MKKKGEPDVSDLQLRAGDKAHDFSFQNPWSGSRRNFYETAKNTPAILLFLRYQGCPVCQMEMALFKREAGLLTRKQTKVFVFLQSTPAAVASASKQADWPFFVVCDPQGLIFHMYRVNSGGIIRYLHPAGGIAAIKAIRQGFKHGKFEGRETQLPAAFVVNPMKTITFAYYGRHIGDLPSPSTLSTSIY
jgi:peroxiredoxin